MGEKKGFVVYHSYRECFEDLSDEEVGILFKAMLSYSETGEMPDMPKPLKVAFRFIKHQIDANKEKYIEKCNKRSEAGAKGGRPRKETQKEKANGFYEDELKAKKANGFSEKQTKAKKADKEEDKEEDKDLLPNGNKKESKKESGSFDAILRGYTGDEETLSLLGEWLKVRKAKRAAMTDYAVRLNIDKLNTMAQESHMGVKEYLKEVICRGWQAFYPINQFEKKGKPPDVDYSHVKGVINL